MWKKLANDVRSNKCLVFAKKAVAGQEAVRVAPLGALATERVRIINNVYSDSTTARGQKSGLNLDIVTLDIRRCVVTSYLRSQPKW